MAIPEAQLTTWSSQGAITSSASTYATIKRALEDDAAKYTSRNFEVFLQGSYGNDTNIYAESDVDVVICYNGAYYKDLDQLSDAEKVAYNAAHTGGASYSYDDFKKHVETALRDAFGDDVKPGTKAINIQARSARRSADVIVAFEHRRYYRYVSDDNCNFYEGISFFTSTGSRTDNFPKMHSANATTKHQAACKNYKGVVRIFKNMRGKLVDDSKLAVGDAPSYFIEGLLYNVPSDCFQGTTWAEIVLKVLKWLHSTTDRTKFLCVNERYYLLRDNSSVCWPKVNGDKFITAAVDLWDQW